MAMDPTFAKLVAVGIMGGVVKSLLGTPRPPVQNFNYNYNGPEIMAESELSKQIEAEKENS